MKSATKERRARLPRPAKGEALLTRLTRAGDTWGKALLLRLAAVGTGFLLSNACVVGAIRPFGVAFAAAARADYDIWAAVGAAAGGLVFSDKLHALQYAGTVALVILVRFVAEKSPAITSSVLFRPLTVALAGLLCAIAIEAAVGISTAGVLLGVSEAMLLGAGAFLGQRSLALLRRGGGCIRLTTRDSVCVLLSAGLFLLALSPLQILGFPLASAAAGLLLLCWSYCTGETGGCLAGVCCGMAAGLAEDGSYTLVSCAMGGLLAGLCAPAGRAAAGAGYAAACLLTMLSVGVAGNPLLYAAAALLACLVFMLLPKRLLALLRAAAAPFSPENIAAETRRIFAGRLRETGRAVEQVSDSVAAVSSMLSKLSEPTAADVTERVRRSCCADCHRQPFCWRHELHSVRTAFNEVFAVLVRDGRLTVQTLPDKLTIMCRSAEPLVAAFNTAFAEYLAGRAQNRAVREAKALAAGQIKLASAILTDLADASRLSFEADLSAAAVAREVFSRDADVPLSVTAAADADGHLFIRATFALRPDKAKRDAACRKLSRRLGLALAPPVVSEDGRGAYRLCCCEAPSFAVRTAYSQRTGTGEQVCGDSYAGFSDGMGHFFLVLSDGMGTGERAALDSVMASSLTATLLKAGVSPACAIGVVNAALLLRGAEESIATLDIAVIDLYTGKTQLFKAGASYSVLQKKGRTAVIEQQSMPLGILSETDFAANSFLMEPDDVLLLLSDGASPLAPSYFKEYFRQKKNTPLKAAVSEITRAAAEAVPFGRSDDITAAAVMLLRT